MCLDEEVDALFLIAGPTEAEVAGSAKCFDREHRLALVAETVTLDTFEKKFDLVIAESKVDIFADSLDDEGEVFGLSEDSNFRGGFVGGFQFFQDFFGTGFAETLELAAVVSAHEQDAGKRQQPGADDGTNEEAGEMVGDGKHGGL